MSLSPLSRTTCCSLYKTKYGKEGCAQYKPAIQSHYRYYTGYNVLYLEGGGRRDVFQNLTVIEHCVPVCPSVSPPVQNSKYCCSLQKISQTLPHISAKSSSAALISVVFSILTDSFSNIILQIAFSKFTVCWCQQKYVFTLTKFKINK